MVSIVQKVIDPKTDEVSWRPLDWLNVNLTAAE